MKLKKKLIAVPAIALAAGLGLTACGNSASPYAQGKAYAIQQYNNGDQASATDMTVLQAWCAENNPGDGAAWNSGCEAGYAVNQPMPPGG
jgi:hypothetical protein